MSDGDGRRKRQVHSDQDRPGAPDIIEWLSQQEPQTRVYTSRYSTAIFYHACISRLGHIWKEIQRGSAWPKGDKIHLRETLGRFHLWGKGLPLDLLDDADDQFEETRNLVLELLCNISGLLSNVLDVLPGHVPNAKEAVILDEYTTLARKLLTRANKDDRSPIAKSEKNAATQSISSWLDEFDFYLDCLTDLVSTIGSVAWADELLPLDSVEAGDRNSKPASVKSQATLEPEHAQSHFVLQVRDKFPLSTEGLAQRLGKANWNRFMQLRREKPQVQEIDLQIKDSGFVRPALPAFSKFYDSAIGSSLGRQSANDGSTLSHTSFASTVVEGETAHFRVPPTPAEAAQGQPFSCSICGQVQSLKNRVAWKMHVFADLQAYTCTFEDCLGNQGPYPQRSTWADHELREHFNKRAWTCRFCDRSETSADSYSKHLQNNHGFILGDQWLGKLLQDDRVTTLKSVKSQTCPLCLKDGWSSHRYYFSHVGRHMEEIALAVLPRDVDEEESNSESSILETVSNSGSPEAFVHSSTDMPLEDPAVCQAAGLGHGHSSVPLVKDGTNTTTPNTSVLEAATTAGNTGKVTHLLDHSASHGNVDETSLPLDNAAMIQEAKSRAPRRVEPEEVLSNTSAQFSSNHAVIHHFTCRTLRIGSWRRVGQNAMDLVIFYSPDKACITYDISSDSAGYRIEFPFAYIKNITLESGEPGLNTNNNPPRPGSLVIELNRFPNFFIDSPGSGDFYQCHDFTEDQQASQVLVHRLEGHPKVLSGQLAKFISLESFRNRKSPSNFVSDTDDDRSEFAYQRARLEAAVRDPLLVPNAGSYTNSPSVGGNLRTRVSLPKPMPTSADQKQTEFLIQDFPEQRKEHANAACQAAQQKRPKNHVFANVTPNDF